MDRCAVLVDAGYLLGAAATLLAGDPDRAGLVVDHAGLVSGLITEAQEQTGMPVLRVLWYDGARDAQPTPEHRSLRVLPDVKLRLGELVWRGTRWQQKGVDSYLQRDLTALARNHAVADVVLVGGDEDLRRALEEAQDYGIRAHLWGVEAAAPEYNQSQSLIAEADRRWIVPEDWIRRFVTLKPAPAPAAPAALPAEVPAPVTGSCPEQAEPTAVPHGQAEPELTPPRTPSPADVARLTSRFGRDVPGAHNAPIAGGWSVDHEEANDTPRLRDLTSARQSWQDNEQDATEATTNPAEVGERFGQRWASRASAEQRAAVLEERPSVPRNLDGELLRHAGKLGIDTWEDESAKFAVRAGFWDALSDHQDGSAQPG